MLSENELKLKIKNTIESFQNVSCASASKELLNVLGYQSSKALKLEDNTAETFLLAFNQNQQLRPEKALVEEWASIEILSQITDDEVREALGQASLFRGGQFENANIYSFLFLSLCLSGVQYTRTQLAAITREINKLFKMPVIVLFNYTHKLSIGIIMRRLHRRDASKDVLEKVTLIKDVDTNQPHRAHIEILFDLSIQELRN